MLLAACATVHMYLFSFGPLPLVSDITGTRSPNPRSSRPQACQPAAENLPVYLVLLGTQAGPGDDERQRKVDNRRVGGGQCWKRGNKQHRKGNGQRRERKLEE